MTGLSGERGLGGYAFLAVALILTACGKTPVPREGAPGPAPAAGPARITRFACPDGSTVEARYPTTDTARIIYKGQVIDMRIAISASGARYVGGGWQWWTKGLTEGTLSPLKPGEGIASAAGMICTAR